MLKAFISDTLVFGRNAFVLMPRRSKDQGFLYEYHVLYPKGNSGWKIASDVFEFQLGPEAAHQSNPDSFFDFLVTHLSFVEDLCVQRITSLVSRLTYEVAQELHLDPRELMRGDVHLTEQNSQVVIHQFKKHLDTKTLNQLKLNTESPDLQRVLADF
ncbi:MAG: hypothetical protein H6608_12555 [Flavobacteriales bacterium]|nr:hypothetical protein [Bacteroidota bacterium]MCB9241963.1 hypothetical protein [Flavobacteriales bacterium]